MICDTRNILVPNPSPNKQLFFLLPLQAYDNMVKYKYKMENFENAQYSWQEKRLNETQFIIQSRVILSVLMRDWSGSVTRILMVCSHAVVHFVFGFFSLSLHICACMYVHMNVFAQYGDGKKRRKPNYSSVDLSEVEWEDKDDTVRYYSTIIYIMHQHSTCVNNNVMCKMWFAFCC